MTTTEKIIGALAIIALVVAGWALTRQLPSSMVTTTAPAAGAISNTDAPAAGTILANGILLPNPSVYDYMVSRVFLYFDKALGYGNATNMPVLEQAARSVFTAATTTPCVLQSPFATATSTFQNLSMQITTGTSTAGLFSVGTSTTPYATSTSIGTGTVAASSQTTMTFAGSANNNIIAPGGYITFGVAGAPNPGFTYGGSCKGLFVSTS